MFSDDKFLHTSGKNILCKESKNLLIISVSENRKHYFKEVFIYEKEMSGSIDDSGNGSIQHGT